MKGPPGDPEDASPVAGVTASTPRVAAKLAVTVLFPFIEMEMGLLVPVTSPLQLLKAYPELAIAVNVTCSPLE